MEIHGSLSAGGHFRTLNELRQPDHFFLRTLREGQECKPPMVPSPWALKHAAEARVTGERWQGVLGESEIAVPLDRQAIPRSCR
ncbi:MAG: hypothetical protein WB946_08495 [Halobacteriota archaeon]|jgi:hypothetical protein